MFLKPKYKKSIHISHKRKSIISLTLIALLFLSTINLTTIPLNHNLTFAKKNNSVTTSNTMTNYSNGNKGTHDNIVNPTRSINIRNLPVLSNNNLENSHGYNDSNGKLSTTVNPALPNNSRAETFEGISKTTAGGSFTPPDVSIATGINHVFEMANTAGEIFTKDSAAVSGPFSLTEFFTPNGSTELLNPISPKIIFDSTFNPEKRWYAISIDRSSFTVRLAVSNSTDSDPIVPYNIYPLSFSNNQCMDYPTIGDSL